jgi:hypothetical protein
VDGVVTSWKALGSSSAQLRVLTPGSILTYTGGAASTPQTLTATATSFPTNLPIKQGDTVGLNILMGSLSMVNNPGATQAYFQPTLLGDNATQMFQAGPNLEVAVQATIQPRPVASISAAPKQKLKRAAVTVSSTENANVKLTAKVKGVKGSLVQSKVLGGGKSALVDLDFVGKMKKRIAKKFAKNKKAKLATTVDALVTDTYGQTSTASVTFKLKK